MSERGLMRGRSSGRWPDRRGFTSCTPRGSRQGSNGTERRTRIRRIGARYGKANRAAAASRAPPPERAPLPRRLRTQERTGAAGRGLSGSAPHQHLCWSRAGRNGATRRLARARHRPRRAARPPARRAAHRTTECETELVASLRMKPDAHAAPGAPRGSDNGQPPNRSAGHGPRPPLGSGAPARSPKPRRSPPRIPPGYSATPPRHGRGPPAEGRRTMASSSSIDMEQLYYGRGAGLRSSRPPRSAATRFVPYFFFTNGQSPCSSGRKASAAGIVATSL
jgi:hypothetical protein